MFLVNGKGSLIRLVAGSFVLGSVILSRLFSEYWLLFTGFVGLMLIISSLTGICPMELVLKAFGVKERKIEAKTESAK